MKRMLSLNKETLTELSADDLGQVQGAAILTGKETYTCPTFPVRVCTSTLFTG